MRILHIDSGREMRGGQWQALALHRGLAEAGHDSMLLARAGAHLLDAAQRSGLACQPLRPAHLPCLWRRFDITHAHDARSHTLAALSRCSPLVVSRRVAFPVKTSAFSKWKYSRASRFLAVSRYVAAQLRAAGIEEGRITIVYDGVTVPSEPAAGDAILVLETADPEKGLALAEEAARMAKVKIEKSSNLAADLPRSRALVYLTYSEGLGSGILLAMAHGLTVIASNVGGIPEIIEGGRNGILVPNDVNAIARAFSRIDPALGRAARSTVIERFTEARMIADTLAAYREVCDGTVCGHA